MRAGMMPTIFIDPTSCFHERTNVGAKVVASQELLELALGGRPSLKHPLDKARAHHLGVGAGRVADDVHVEPPWRVQARQDGPAALDEPADAFEREQVQVLGW